MKTHKIAGVKQYSYHTFRTRKSVRESASVPKGIAYITLGILGLLVLSFVTDMLMYLLDIQT